MQDAFENLPTAPDPQFHSFDYPQQGFHNPPPHQQHQPHHNPPFPAGQPGPPTPPTQAAFGQQQQPSSTNGTNGAFNGLDHQMTGDIAQPKSEPDDLSNGRGGSEEDNLTPAQSKRKAQNRAAYVPSHPPRGIKARIEADKPSSQRAFRERKEKHVKDLETKLADLEAAQQHASAENERLKRDLQKMATENEILKATGGPSSGPNAASHLPEPLTTGPMRYSPTDFASNVLSGHNNKTFSHRIVESADGQRLLAAGASWDFIISHDLFKQGLVDIGAVSEHLKTRATCDGQGPVFSEKDVLEAIELSVACGTDDLL